GPQALNEAVGDGGSTRVAWWVIVAEGEDVGAVWMERSNEADITVDLGIFIALPEWRGRGLGRIAVRLAEQQVVEQWGIGYSRLRVRQANARAIACYRALGYRTVATGEKVTGGGRVEVLEMVHDLRGDAP
ncbi:MAG: GCN5-related N-acetyltransferase, partial [Akkermansiaceae bacterium]|nr:GCN5-related N-acetyltransferase [Akkermansiaceae bacterium]